jgi:thiosulfate/3-mercaptopyruvate sulfurtransferase
MPWLITAAQLDKFRKNQKSLLILDATRHPSSEQRDAKQEFIDKHIPGALFLDIDAFSNQDPTTAHNNLLLLEPAQLSEKLAQFGIKNDYKIILYDNSSMHTSCRALWMLKMVGHNPQLLYILDGGIKAWEQYGGKTEAGGVLCNSTKPYLVNLQLQHLRSLAEIKTNLQHPAEQIMDARHPVRFCGGQENNPGVRSGHIPGSYCLPYFSFFDANGLWKSVDKIRQLFFDIGAELKAPVISTCGSGITAPIINFALDIVGHEKHAMYNGSWNEWGSEKIYTHELSIEERPIGTCLLDK